MALHVKDADDRVVNEKRGRGEPHAGYVYFSDGRRVGYHNEAGVVPGIANWLPVTPTHVRLAKAFLETSGLVDSAFPED